MKRTYSVKQSFDLTGRVAIITGGSGMLGVKHAEAIAELGGIPILIDIDKKDGYKKAIRISKEYQVDCIFEYCDISDESQIIDLKDLLLRKYDQIDPDVFHAMFEESEIVQALLDIGYTKRLSKRRSYQQEEKNDY